MELFLNWFSYLSSCPSNWFWSVNRSTRVGGFIFNSAHQQTKCYCAVTQESFEQGLSVFLVHIVRICFTRLVVISRVFVSVWIGWVLIKNKRSLPVLWHSFFMIIWSWNSVWWLNCDWFVLLVLSYEFDTQSWVSSHKSADVLQMKERKFVKPFFFISASILSCYLGTGANWKLVPFGTNLVHGKWPILLFR